MRKVSVGCQVFYTFDIEIPENEDDIIGYVDVNDPVYQEMTKVLSKKHLNFEGEIISIIDENTGEVLYND